MLGIDAVEFMQTKSDFGELFLIQNKTANGEWSALHIEQAIYFRRDSSQRICVEYSYYYCNKQRDFFPTYLTVHQNSQKSFPIGLFEFWVFKRLQHLQMSYIDLVEFNRIGLLGADALNKLDLSHNALSEIPSKAFSSAWNLTEVDLSYNQIASMASDVFKVEFHSIRSKQNMHAVSGVSSLLEIIRLNNNNLTFIDTEWFSNLSYLTTLTLNDNHLSEFDAYAIFNTNTALRTLYLQNNEFSSISTTGFFDDQCFGELNTFDISNNPKNTNDETICVNAKTVNISNTNSQQCIIPRNAVTLRANYNRINLVTVELPNTNLTYLYLNQNQIDSIDFLRALEHLEEIYLSHNVMTQMNANVFENMNGLKRLDISHNKFATIDFAFIASATSLQYLDISNNLLSGQFELNVNASALAELNIANNNYTSLQHNLKKSMPKLERIDVNNNFFNCENLTAMLLFMHFDHITAVIQSEDELSDTNNVRGIKCQQPKDDLDAKKLKENISYKITKETLIKTIDDKLANIETKLIDLFKNMTASNTMDND